MISSYICTKHLSLFIWNLSTRHLTVPLARHSSEAAEALQINLPGERKNYKHSPTVLHKLPWGFCKYIFGLNFHSWMPDFLETQIMGEILNGCCTFTSISNFSEGKCNVTANQRWRVRKYNLYSEEENSEAMFVVLFLKSCAHFVDILDLNLGFTPGKNVLISGGK